MTVPFPRPGPGAAEVVRAAARDSPDLEVLAGRARGCTACPELAALDVLRDVATLVLVGSKDRITPLDHSRAIAEALPTAELVVVEGAGHMVQLERADEVNGHLRRLLDRAVATARSA